MAPAVAMSKRLRDIPLNLATEIAAIVDPAVGIEIDERTQVLHPR